MNNMDAEKRIDRQRLYTVEEIIEKYKLPYGDDQYKKDYIRSFSMMLMELNIKFACFKNMDDEWRFNEDGGELFKDIILNRGNKDEVYKSLRKGKAYKRKYQKYSWIMYKAILNLNSVRENARIEGREDFEIYYPEPIEVFCNFWQCMYIKANKNIFFLPWLAMLQDYEDEIRQVRESWMEDDVLYIGGLMFDELRGIRENHFGKETYDWEEDQFITKWVRNIKELILYRVYEMTINIHRIFYYLEDARKICKELQLPNARRSEKLSEERKFYKERCEMEEAYIRKIEGIVKSIKNEKEHFRFLPKRIDSSTICEIIQENQFKKCFWKRMKRDFKRQRVKIGEKIIFVKCRKRAKVVI